MGHGERLRRPAYDVAGAIVGRARPSVRSPSWTATPTRRRRRTWIATCFELQTGRPPAPAERGRFTMP